ncbi:MAG: phosphatase PAP2 family protein [Anaerolineales bacterium]|nr:phosphatase PAP2 family protein [Anaerolineales bacterium]
MTDILDSGIQLIQALQSLGDGFIAFMQAITFLGDEEFYLLLMPLVYWCISARFGFRLGIMLMVSNSLNTYLKFILHLPRPYWYSREVEAYVGETSFGAPSGHSQNSVALWGLMAAKINKAWAWIIAVLVMVLVGVSRLAMGVHFHLDALTGWLTGAVLLWLFLKLQTPVANWFEKKSDGAKIGFAALISVGIILVGWLIVQFMAGWQLPAEWVANASAAQPDGEPIHPLAISGLVTNAAVLFGMISGVVGMNRLGGFSASGPLWQRIARYALGLLILLAIWAGLDAIFPDGESLVALAARFLRYGLVGAWVALGGPWLFMRIGLAKGLAASK